MALSAIAEDYFRSMNPLASKIHEDICDAKNSYENIWDTLSEKEKVSYLASSFLFSLIVRLIKQLNNNHVSLRCCLFV